MKKLLFLVFLALSLSGMTQERHIDVTVQPIDLYSNSAVIGISFQEGRNALNATYGTPIHASVMDRTFGGMYINPNDYNFFDMYTRIVRVGYRHYITTPMRLYWELSVKSQTAVFNGDIINQYAVGNGYVSEGNSTFRGMIYNTSFGCQLGHQWVISKILLFDVYAGLQVLRTNGRIHTVSDNMDDTNNMAAIIDNTVRTHLPNNANCTLDMWRDGNEYVIDGVVNGYARVSPFFGFKFGARIF